MRWKIVCLIFTFLGQLFSTDAELVGCPSSQITKKAGDQVEFRCKSSHNYALKWYVVLKDSDGKTLLINGYEELPGYKYNVNPDNCALKFIATKETDGNYICEEPGTLSRCSVNLSVDDTPERGKQTSPAASSGFGGIWAGDALRLLVLCFLGAESAFVFCSDNR